MLEYKTYILQNFITTFRSIVVFSPNRAAAFEVRWLLKPIENSFIMQYVL